MASHHSHLRRVSYPEIQRVRLEGRRAEVYLAPLPGCLSGFQSFCNIVCMAQ